MRLIQKLGIVSTLIDTAEREQRTHLETHDTLHVANGLDKLPDCTQEGILEIRLDVDRFAALVTRNSETGGERRSAPKEGTVINQH